MLTIQCRVATLTLNILPVHALPEGVNVIVQVFILMFEQQYLVRLI